MLITTFITKLNNDKINLGFHFTLYNHFVVYIYDKKTVSSINNFISNDYNREMDYHNYCISVIS